MVQNRPSSAPQHPHVLPGLARSLQFGRKSSENELLRRFVADLSLANRPDLVRSSLRPRPDRIPIGDFAVPKRSTS